MHPPRYPTTPMCDGALLAAFEPTTRPTDVFVATSAKCGQTWLLALLHHLRTGGTDPGFGGKGALGATPWLEQPRDMTTGRLYDRERRLAELAALPDPRVFKLHVTFAEVPRPPGSAAKVLNVVRDPRDVPWSMYQHLVGLRPELSGGAPPPFDAWFEGWLDRGYYFEVARSFWARRGDPDVMLLRYEDLKRDLAGEASRIVAFLGWAVDDDALARAVALAGLEAMQASEGALGMGGAFREGHRFVREGAVGRNRARLSEAQRERLLERARHALEPACFAWVTGEP